MKVCQRKKRWKENQIDQVSNIFLCILMMLFLEQKKNKHIYSNILQYITSANIKFTLLF